MSSESQVGNHEYGSCLHAFLICISLIWSFAYEAHLAINSLVGGDVVPLRIPSSIIHFSHALRRNALNGLFIPISTGWHSDVQPPGICST